MKRPGATHVMIIMVMPMIRKKMTMIRTMLVMTVRNKSVPQLCVLQHRCATRTGSVRAAANTRTHDDGGNVDGCGTVGTLIAMILLMYHPYVPASWRTKYVSWRCLLMFPCTFRKIAERHAPLHPKRPSPSAFFFLTGCVIWAGVLLRFQ